MGGQVKLKLKLNSSQQSWSLGWAWQHNLLNKVRWSKFEIWKQANLVEAGVQENYLTKFLVKKCISVGSCYKKKVAKTCGVVWKLITSHPLSSSIMYHHSFIHSCTIEPSITSLNLGWFPPDHFDQSEALLSLTSEWYSVLIVSTSFANILPVGRG